MVLHPNGRVCHTFFLPSLLCDTLTRSVVVIQRFCVCLVESHAPDGANAAMVVLTAFHRTLCWRHTPYALHQLDASTPKGTVDAQAWAIFVSYWVVEGRMPAGS